jgi:hypothetical protein
MMMKTKYATWCGGAAAAAAIAVIVGSCGGTGGGGGHHGNPDEQFILNSNNAGRLILNVDPNEVDANKSDRIGLVATLTDSQGNPVRGAVITFFSDVDDITFIPGQTNANGNNTGTAVTDSHGNADIIAVAGGSPTGTGDIVGTAAIFAAPPPAFGLLAQTQVTLLDVGFVDADTFAVIPQMISVTEPAPGSPIFFNIVGGTPPYFLSNEVSGIGTATLSDHCAPGCTENGGALCIGSPCALDADCGVGSPDGTCVGPIKRCLASCHGSNCAGSRCDTDADCNDGAAAPANVCKDSGQAILFVLTGVVAGTTTFDVHDSAGGVVTVTVTVDFVCGNGVARGDEQCDLGDLREQDCTTLGFSAGTLLCKDTCVFDTSNCTVASPGAGTATPSGPTPTGVTPTPTSTPGAPTATGSTATPTPGPGVPSNLSLAFVAAGQSGDNGNNTLTTVLAATVTDSNGNPVPNGTAVTFIISGTTHGAVINSPSQTNTDPPCDVTNFETDAMVTVLNQPGVAHTCVTYPNASNGMTITVMGSSGAASDTQMIVLPPPPP